MALIAVLATFLPAAWAQIPNASFENWTAAGGYSTPDGWDNFNALTSSASVYTCEQGTTGAPHGSSFIMLTTRMVGSSAVPGLAMSGKYDFVAHKPKSGFPFTGRPGSLTGKWQYVPQGTDTGRIAVYLTKWNTATNNRDFIAAVEYDLPGTVASWASFSIPITYLSAAAPDSAIIGLVSSNKGATPGTYLYVDSLNFAGFAAGISATADAKYNATLSPNPAKDNLSVDFGAVVTEDIELQVIDRYGRMVASAAWTPGSRVYSMSLGTLVPGMYFVKIKLGEDMQAQRLVVQ